MFAKRGDIVPLQHPPWCRLSVMNLTPQNVDYLVGHVAGDLGYLSSMKHPRKQINFQQRVFQNHSFTFFFGNSICDFLFCPFFTGHFLSN